MSWEDEDVFMGNYEIGESLRGMQDRDAIIGAAQRALAQRGLRGNLGQLAQRFNPHAPLQRQVRPAYKDSTQIGLKATGTFTSTTWSGSTSLPQITATTRVYESFKPNKGILNELVIATYTNDSDVAVTRSTNVSDASDVVLVSAFAGAKNCFPNAPNQDNGIPGSAFSPNSLGNGISWPTLNGGIDMVVAFAVEDTILYRVTPPSGYTQDDLTSIEVRIRFALLGPSLRP